MFFRHFIKKEIYLLVFFCLIQSLSVIVPTFEEEGVYCFANFGWLVDKMVSADYRKYHSSQCLHISCWLIMTSRWPLLILGSVGQKSRSGGHMCRTTFLVDKLLQYLLNLWNFCKNVKFSAKIYLKFALCCSKWMWIYFYVKTPNQIKKRILVVRLVAVGHSKCSPCIYCVKIINGLNNK